MSSQGNIRQVQNEKCSLEENKKEMEEERGIAFLKNINVMKNQERLRKYPRLKESRVLTMKHKTLLLGRNLNWRGEMSQRKDVRSTDKTRI